MKWLARYSMLALAGLLLASPAFAQGDRPKQNPPDDEPIKLHTTLVQVPVVVKEKGGRYLTDLRKDDFIIYEDGARQTIEYFGTTEEPFNVALLLDSSGSTADQLQQIKSAALAFIDNLRPQDKVLLVEFNDSVRILSELTGDREQLRRAIADIRAGEYTQVYEAVYTAVWERLADIEGRKAVVLFTDGIDNASSEIVEEDTLDAVIESEDVIVYPIRFSTRADVEHRIERKLNAERLTNPQKAEADHQKALRELDRAYRQADEYLDELARLSGGVVERADEVGDLKGALARIADELRKQYLLGYYPPNEKQITSRRITVKVSRPDAVVRARPGYKTTQ
ncbi:MAG TPA: VWA domain-containing protein [Blastocatellia bacterium]|nr:VWA domain-containing protein [Blastocatellia bacterium]